MDKIQKLKKEIAKQAVVFTTGGFKPTNSISESWIGKVYLFKENEEIPKDNNGELMIPLLQLCFENLPFIPEIFATTKALTVFISKELPVDLTINGNNWMIREYKKEDQLLVKQFTSNTFLKAFPLKPVSIEEDYPVWDGGGLSDQQTDKILDLENLGIIENYDDFTENRDGHKIGGYPSFCQPGIYFGDNFEFALQIATDPKANLNIVDNGTIFLAKNRTTNQWKYYCDFY